MKNFGIKTIKNVIDIVCENEEPTGNQFLDDRYEEQRKFAAGNTLPYYRIFYRLAEKLNPKFIVELGSFQATAAAHFAGPNKDCMVATIDIHKDPGQDLDEIRCHEAEEQLENLIHIKGWTWDDHVVDAIKSFNRPIDILFIDAWHRYDYVQREWDIYKPLLANKALVIYDDVFDAGDQFPGMEKWWSEIPYKKFIDNRPHMGIPMGFAIFERK